MTESRTVLIVDDDQNFRRVMEYQLHEDGYRVLTASNVTSAVQRFQADAVDLVMTDVKMPGGDGLELLARLKAIQPDLPILILTAHGTIGAAVEAMKLGAADYLTKPFTREQLRIALGKMLDVVALRQENRRLREVVAERFSFASMVALGSSVRTICPTACARASTGSAGCTWSYPTTGSRWRMSSASSCRPRWSSMTGIRRRRRRTSTSLGARCSTGCRSSGSNGPRRQWSQTYRPRPLPLATRLEKFCLDRMAVIRRVSGLRKLALKTEGRHAMRILRRPWGRICADAPVYLARLS
jgi:FixJ family two-component response regulator